MNAGLAKARFTGATRGWFVHNTSERTDYLLSKLYLSVQVVVISAEIASRLSNPWLLSREKKPRNICFSQLRF